MNRLQKRDRTMKNLKVISIHKVQYLCEKIQRTKMSDATTHLGKAEKTPPLSGYILFFFL